VDSAGNLTLSYTPNNQVPQQKLYEKLKSMLGQLGMHPGHLIPRNIYMKTDIPIAGCAHQAGTCRFGTDAKSSVLDRNCNAHELDNLYVVDTSFFVSIGALNPNPLRGRQEAMVAHVAPRRVRHASVPRTSNLCLLSAHLEMQLLPRSQMEPGGWCNGIVDSCLCYGNFAHFL
jgi:choline dehydrogenase-like flavoprotein